MNNIKMGKLVSGELVIGELVIDGTNGESYLKNAHSIRIVQTQQGNQPAVVPFLDPFSNDKVDIELKHIIGLGDPVDGLKQFYMQLTSGLLIPTAAQANQINKNIKVVK